MSDRKYIGITIGPILQTLEEAGTPAALWFASSMNSSIIASLSPEVRFFTSMQLFFRFDQKNLSGAYDTYGRHTDIFTVLFRDNSG